MNTAFLLNIASDSFFLISLAWCTYADLKRREIPNEAIFTILALGVVKFIFAIFLGLMWCVYPLGILISIPFVIVWLNGKIGGGDVKLLAACGLYLGLWNTFIACIIMLFILLGIMAIRLFQKEKIDSFLPLAPAIAIGCLGPLLMKFI